MNHLTEGTWVLYTNLSPLGGFSGFIIDEMPSESESKVLLTKDDAGNSIRGITTLPKKYLIPMEDNLKEEDILSLIDLSLMMKDEQWFLELAVKMPVELPF